MMMPSSEPDAVVSVLHAAAGSGSVDCFEAVLAALDADEVWKSDRVVGRCTMI